MRTINQAELTTILAALRHYQNDDRPDIYGDGRQDILDEEGIEALCETLNFSETVFAGEGDLPSAGD